MINMEDDKENTPLLISTRLHNQTVRLRNKHFVVILILLVFHVPSGMITYIIPEYIHQRLDANTPDGHALDNYTYDACASNASGPGPQYEHYKYVQRETALWQNYYALARSVPAVISSLVWVSYSDTVGRKLPWAVCILGYVLNYICIGLVVHFKAELRFLLIGGLADGVMGSYGSFSSLLFTYVADVTETGKRRTIGLVLMEVTADLAYAVVTIACGYLFKMVGYFYASMIGAGGGLFALVMVIVILPETLPERKPGGIKKLLSGVVDSLKFYLKQNTRIKQLKYILIILALLVYWIQNTNRDSIETLYQLGKPFCWSSTKIGWFGSARIGTYSIMGMALISIFKKKLADDTIAVMSAAVTIASYIVEALAKSEAVLFTVPVLAMLSILPIPVMRSILSQLTPEEKQGAVFASIGAVNTLATIIGPQVTNLVYYATVSIMGGFVFLVLASITALSGVILCIYMCVARRHPELDQRDDCAVN